MKKRGKIIVFTGPSGVGKETVKKLFINDKRFNLRYSISATSRPKRKDELNGKNYHFLTKEKFEKWIKKNKFLEWVIFANNYYGTPDHFLNKYLKKGENVLLEIELIGAKKVIKKYPDAVTIFLLPPKISDLEKRLSLRKTENEEEIRKRIEIAKAEIKEKDLFKYRVVNKEPKESAKEIIEILKKELL
ncbi:guanylate kinase [Candidatus Hepatoplasma crinochetorum]|uniref:guanylate kinase n=1 Tax=Candidatus Hepatoplasma crinochetorum TaxID=295596 RepID=UPI00308DE47E|nr:MAG: guanylate kinase [Candidatus Hepatoplasma crinochetorum]